MKLNSLLYYKSKLDAHDQAIYDEMFQHWMHLDTEFIIKKPHCDLADLIQAVHLDNPLLFYIDYYQVEYNILPFSYRVHGGYLYSCEETKRYLNDCENWGRKIMQMLPDTGINEKALWIHDLIIANVRYGNNENINSHNLIGVIKDKIAVCEGISKAYKFLCDLANIPCIVVTGQLEQEPHGWNMLWVGGGTSFVDVTNDIRNGGGYDRNHFLRSSAEMKGYQWDRTIIPECRIRNKTNAFFTVHDKRELLDTLRKNEDKESISVSLAFGHPLNGDDIQRMLNGCALLYPKLALRDISYSLDQQMLYIRK
jgi:hypothetical protein